MRRYSGALLLSATAAALFAPLEATATIFMGSRLPTQTDGHGIAPDGDTQTQAHSAGNTGVAEGSRLRVRGANASSASRPLPFPWQKYYQAGDGHEHLAYRINVTNIREFAKEKQRASEEDTERQLTEVALGVLRDALKKVASGKTDNSTTAILTSMRTHTELLQAYREVLAARKEDEPMVLEDELKESTNRLTQILRLPEGLGAEKNLLREISQNIEDATGTAKAKANFAAVVLEHVANKSFQAATDNLCETPTTSLERAVEEAWKNATTVTWEDGKAKQRAAGPAFFAAADKNGETQENEHALRKFFRSETAKRLLPKNLMDLSAKNSMFVEAWENQYGNVPGMSVSRRELMSRKEPLALRRPRDDAQADVSDRRLAENLFNGMILRSLLEVTKSPRPGHPLHPQSLRVYRRFLKWKHEDCKHVNKHELQQAAVAVLKHATELPRKIGEFLVEQAEACAGDSRTTTTTGCGVGDRGSDELPKLITSFRFAYLSQNGVAEATQRLAWKDEEQALTKKGEESVVTQYLQNTLASASPQVVTVDQGATDLVKNHLKAAGASPVNFKALQSIRRTQLCGNAKPEKTVRDAIANGFHGIDITGSVLETESQQTGAIQQSDSEGGPSGSESDGSCNVDALFASLKAQLTGENGRRFTEESPFVLRLHVLEGVGALRKPDKIFYESLLQAVRTSKELKPVASRIQLEFGHTPRLQELVTPEDGREAAGRVEEQPDEALRSAVELLQMPFAKKVFNVNAHSNMLIQPGYDYQKLKKKLQKVFSTPEYCETEGENRCSFSIGADGAGAMGKDLADVNAMYVKYFQADAEDPVEDEVDELARNMSSLNLTVRSS